ncbi:hypothetical protein PCASD_13044 [Puccinia coronata f. sp. avenae]|uniref:Paired domain-containing protein n=1 Tax=Puccinia coronata f. sp. avenae TaxID=200324 RepID=A0A2N5U4F3_9BASI|nr:hypothetical protein PCASD_13044 [Puccinia coronata f. sp. avenae]
MIKTTIARKFGMVRQTISGIVARFSEQQTVVSAPKPGKPWKTDDQNLYARHYHGSHQWPTKTITLSDSDRHITGSERIARTTNPRQKTHLNIYQLWTVLAGPNDDDGCSNAEPTPAADRTAHCRPPAILFPNSLRLPRRLMRGAHAAGRGKSTRRFSLNRKKKSSRKTESAHSPSSTLSPLLSSPQLQ